MAIVRRQTDEERKARDFTVPAARYVIGSEEFKRFTSKRSGNDFIKVKWFVVGPGSRGKRTWTSASCDISKSGTLLRWQFWAEAVGVEEPFEIGNTCEGNNHEGDRNIGRLLMGRAIVVEMARVQSDGYWNNDIKKYIPRDKWSAKEAAAAKAWEDEFREKMEQSVDPEDFACDGDPMAGDDGVSEAPPDDDEMPW